MIITGYGDYYSFGLDMEADTWDMDPENPAYKATAYEALVKRDTIKTTGQARTYAASALKVANPACTLAVQQYRDAHKEANRLLGDDSSHNISHLKELLRWADESHSTCAKVPAVTPQKTGVKVAPPPAVIKQAGSSWLLWAALAFGGVYLLKKGKKKKRSKKARR